MVIPAGEVQFNRGWIAENHLPHTCTIWRHEKVGETPYEEPIYEWVEHATDVGCRFWVQSGGERSDDRRTVTAYEYRLKVTTGTDITEDDLIDDVVNQLGEPMQVNRLRVTAVWKRTHETICVLEEVT